MPSCVSWRWWPNCCAWPWSASEANVRRKVLTILLVTLVTSSCAGSVRTAPPPPRPTLETLTVTPNGGICMEREDAKELLLYVDQLERRQ